MTSYWIFIIFLITLGLTNSVFAEPVDVEIDWIIEGQTNLADTSMNESNVELNNEDDFLFNEKIENYLSPMDEINEDDFITGSEYTIDNKIITIESTEGQLLNQLLIEQRALNKENFLHMIKYLDRYSDGYVELAEALIDPVRQQNYQQGGVGRDYNINSNLEHFLAERGYDLSNPESIPNNAFSPTKYDAVRAAASAAANEGVASTDLRELLPNYVKPDSDAIKNEMIRKLNEQTTNVYDSISSSNLEISVAQSPDLANTINDNLFDDFKFVNTKFDNSNFENTQHVIDTLNKPQNILDISPSTEYPIFILISGLIILGLIIFGYLLYRRTQIKIPLPMVIVSQSINYVQNTNDLIESSRKLFENNSPKFAFEKFSQAIRYYYSHKLEINLDLTTSQIMIELKKSNIDNFEDVKKWLLLCGQVEFVKHKSTEKEFLRALDSFSQSLS